MGSTHELQGDPDAAIQAYEHALRHNNYSIQALNAISCILRTKENFPRAIEYLQAILKVDGNNGEVWGSLGHCYLMIENLQEAYAAYQQALYHLRDPKEPKLWYGIGILYDRYGSLEHAEEAFSQVMHMQPDFEKANEIYFRLGIIYKQQQKYPSSLENPPRPLTEEDIWFQIGHVYEQQKDTEAAKNAYHRVLDRNAQHAKVLQQLGWLYHQESGLYQSQEKAIEYLEKSVSSDNNDAQSWYLLGRCYMSQSKYSKAYEAYQQAVYRDGRNPTFWCSIGVLYYQINQYRDALDAYSRAIRLNPYISEVWYDLGTLYESCNNQTNDALDAYQRAFDLDPSNMHIKARLQLLRNNGQSTGMPNQQGAPVPQDVHPQQYQGPGVGAPPGHQWGPPSGPNQVLHSSTSALQPQSQDWNRRLGEPPHQPSQPQSSGPYDRRDPPRPPPSQRPLSPRIDSLRQYQEPPRDAPIRRSPPPPLNHPAPSSYPAPQALPQPQPSAPQPSTSSRLTSSAYGPADPGVRFPATGPQGPSMNAPPYGRPGSPPPDIKPLSDVRPPSPGHGPRQQPYQHQPSGPQPAIVAGAPPPAAAFAAAEAAARDRDDRPHPHIMNNSLKRTHEPDEEMRTPNKYAANGDNRSKLEDSYHRRPSPPDRKPSPRQLPISPRLPSPRGRAPSPPMHHPSRSASIQRRDEQRRADDSYHPSEAAHHPPTLPSMQLQQNEPPSQASAPEPIKDDKKETYEGPARKMDVDENYDDEMEEEKRKTASGGRNSPQRANAIGAAAVETDA
ncbi:uncharacterized protein KY384_004426 [Bacidia gigantensis]|uniref:uncharacterized protein n=1 Tax=Bacidia gigantensis TaxID=2732470 RepID=UPI001D046DFC|nr:uncharacterized protein KY384_004426 [Bacidia gigantensis]KAG8531069.1 hypothetical protein KY384_004426 [Bacidia gigantensis]